MLTLITLLEDQLRCLLAANSNFFYGVQFLHINNLNFCTGRGLRFVVIVVEMITLRKWRVIFLDVRKQLLFHHEKLAVILPMSIRLRLILILSCVITISTTTTSILITTTIKLLHWLSLCKHV